MIKINLNPKKEKRDLKKIYLPDLKGINLPNLNNLFFLLIPIASMIAMLVYYIYISSKINSLYEEKSYLEQEINKYENVKRTLEVLREEIKENEKLARRLELTLKTYEFISQNRSFAGNLLKNVLRDVPEGVWLENIELGIEKSVIHGYALQPNLIASYYNKLSSYLKIDYKGTESLISSTNTIYYNFNFEINKANQEETNGN